MKFGALPVVEAEGAVLAHSLRLPERLLKKGTVLTRADLDTLAAAGLDEVTVAMIGAGDLDENTAAARIAAVLAAPGLTATEPFTGRVNIVARHPGLLCIAAERVHAMNAIDEAVTLATLPDHVRVAEGALVATVKIIPYAAPTRAVEAAIAALGSGALTLHPNAIDTADLILTRTAAMKDSLLDKAEAVTAARLTALGVTLGRTIRVAHEDRALAEALAECDAGLLLILGASATSDRADIAPAGLVRAGGVIHRFGMPVDPGNLLFLGRLDDRPVLGLPGCARSPAPNGADWVLERLVAGLAVTDGDIARMGVGGLLKESPARRQPRKGPPTKGRQIELILLAAGASRRMRGADKLLRKVEDVPLLRRSAETALRSKSDAVHVVLAEGDTARRTVLDGLDVNIVETQDWREGMAGSLRAGLNAVAPAAAAVIVALADMPEVTADHIDRLIAAFDPEAGSEICRAATEDGKPGHPVLFSRRFFENLADLRGDRGAREVLALVPDMVVTVPTTGDGAVIDLDTPEAWARWEAAG